jgi:hypothetical protein
MAASKHRKTLALAVAFWVTGTVSAAALAYTLNRPLAPRAVRTQRAEPVPALEQEPVADEAVTLNRPLVLREVTIVSKAHRPARAQPIANPAPAEEITPPKEISQMNCAGRRPLDMGSGSVQICE